MKTFNLILIQVLICGTLFAQDAKVNPGEQSSQVRFDLPPNKTAQVDQPFDSRVNSLTVELMNAKRSGDVNRIAAVQSELDRLTGSVSVVSNPGNGMVTVSGSKQGGTSLDNIVATQILQRSNVKALAVAVEQRGSTAGRIWIAVGIGGAGNNNDTLYLLFSDNNGNTWSWGGGGIHGGYTINNDEIDLEIIENTTGPKYIWAVYGLTSASSGARITDFVITNGSSVSIGGLPWPNTSSNVRVYRPRITSDNAYYLSNAWTYIAVCRDSVMPGLGNMIRTEEWVARCDNPYTVTPTITFKPNRFGYSNLLYPSQTYRDYTDLAYYWNGTSDSIIVTEANLPDSTRIYLAKTSISNFVNGTNTYAFSSIQGTASWKTHGRIASNGAYPNLMIVCDQRYSASDWDIPYFYCTNGGAFTWSTGYVDYRTNYTIWPDIIGRRNSVGKFYTTYISEGVFDSVISHYTTNGVWGPATEPSNQFDASVAAAPKPGFRFVQNDSCISVWSRFPATDIWISGGCTGQVVSGIINNNNAPLTYELEQNYPNPFNPETNIKFTLPKAGLVTLTIYNILGKETAVLINKQMSAGNQSIEWNASNYPSGVYFYKLKAGDFIDTKKMVLIK